MAKTVKDPAPHTLTAQKREVYGKRLKKARREGQLAANIYGPGFTSASIFISYRDFSKVFSKAHETGIIQITLNGSQIPVLARQVQRHPLSHDLLHVDFRKVDLTKKIETEVPVKIVGEAPAVEQHGGVLLTQAAHLVVESLPSDIPQEIEVDVTGMSELGTEIKVADLKKSGNFEFKEEPDKVVLSIVAHKEESLEPEVAAPVAEEGATTEGAAPAEGGEAVPAAEGDQKAEDKPAEGKPEAKAEKQDKKGE